jgi:hypothetical protein
MNEADTPAEYIDPALQAARAKAEIADSLLVYRNTKLAVTAAKGTDQHLKPVA